jgi:predicted Na+-dependent transporter
VTRIADALERFLLPLVMVAAAAGIAFPGPGRRLDAANGILIALAVLVFCTGASMTFTDIGLLGAHSTTSQLGLLATLALVVALPLLAGSATRTLDPLAGREQAPLRIIGLVSLLILLWEVASELHLQVSDARMVAAVALYLTCAAGLGWLLGTSVNQARRTAVLLPTAMRDFAVAAGIAARAFGAPAAAPLGIYGILVLVFGSVAVHVIRRPRPRPA